MPRGVSPPSSAQAIAPTARVIELENVLREDVVFGARHWGGLSLLGYGRHNRPAAVRALALVSSSEVAVAGQTPQGISGSQCLEIGAIERGAPRQIGNIPESPLPALPLYTFGGTL